VNKPGDAAYCIYTSGTSGEPKGVIIENHSVVNHLNVTRNKFYAKNGNAATPLFTSFAFDFVVPTIFGTLLFGDTLAVTNDVQSLALYAENNPLAVLKITPSYFNSSYDCFNNHKGKVSTIVFGGETLTAETIGHVRQVFGDDIRIFNEYGPTETTVFTSTAEIHSSDTIVTIGKPVENSHIYMMNGSSLCGIGVPGELCITGTGVARGYLNRPELTDEKFVKNPFGEGRMYRSGDLARWLPDGNIEFIGRIDEQVKIRGIRIELGEIESKLREIDGILDCAVVAKDDKKGEKAIFAYFIGSGEMNVSEVRSILSGVLPDYMVPAYMMQIDVLPQNRNGKLDVRALPEIEAMAYNAYVEPRNDVEKIICGIFSEVLNVEKVGIKDGFFELGGHSLRATRLVNSIEEQTGVKIALKDVFTHTTPEELASIVENRTGEIYEAIPIAEVKDYYPMSSTQKRTYLIQQLAPESTAYNMPYKMKMTGEVHPDKLKEALQGMIDRHEILRTAFLTVDGEPVQKILDNIEAEFEYVTSSESDDKLIDEYFRPFDLSRPPFVRVKLVNKGEYHLFLMDMHHIITDGMSQNVFIGELTALYNGEKLEPLTHQYKDYSEWMRTRDLTSQENYWKEQFSEEAPVLDMPTDFVRPQIQSYLGRTISTVTDEQLSQGIRKIAEQTGATEYMIFL
ncbi:MAG: AMP-binding protein, partial [Clostridia bacterium]|nr:AMP-binding protein [Clostridia bacterium]